MSDRNVKPPASTQDDEILVRITSPQIDLSSVLVIDPAVLYADSDPMTEWVRATTEGIGNMSPDEWLRWVAEYEVFAA
jgi:hypothetical protein